MYWCTDTILYTGRPTKLFTDGDEKNIDYLLKALFKIIELFHPATNTIYKVCPVTGWGRELGQRLWSFIWQFNFEVWHEGDTGHCTGQADKQLVTPGTVDTVDTAQHTRVWSFRITEKAPTRAFSWLKAATTAFTFKTLCLLIPWINAYLE